VNGPEVMEPSSRGVGHGAVLCGARKRQGEGTCGQAAGWGTDHPGDGPCKLHGGNTRNHRTAAAARQVEDGARRALADMHLEPVDNPLQALALHASEVMALRNYLRGEVSRLESLRYQGGTGEQVRAELSAYQSALRDTTSVLTAMAKLNLDDRLIAIQSRISEQQGMLIATAVRLILDDLGLTPQQHALVPKVVPARLRELSGSSPDAVRKYEALVTRRLTLEDFDREIDLLRAERDALPEIPRGGAWPGWGTGDSTEGTTP
jgi:hypothetical protein